MSCFNNFQKNISLAQFTTFRIGGPARYFFIAKTSQDLVEAVRFAQKKDLPFFILGGGSNLLVSDKGYDGLVIKINNEQRTVNNNIISSEAGTKLSDLVSFSIENNLTGLEWAIGIPGTIGGAVKTNASCFGGEMKKIVKKIEKIDNIILSVELELKKGTKEQSRELAKEIIKKRKQTQPLEYLSAGCIFKNPSSSPAGYLIDQAGLKGKKIGQAQISSKHANFIINLGHAKARDVIKLIDLIKKTIEPKYRIELEEEIQYLGEL